MIEQVYIHMSVHVCDVDVCICVRVFVEVCVDIATCPSPLHRYGFSGHVDSQGEGAPLPLWVTPQGYKLSRVCE